MDLREWPKFYFIISFIFLQTTDFVQCQNICVSGLVLPGYTVPRGDILLEYGEPLDIMCVLYNVTKYKIFTFKRNNETIPPEMIEVVNSTAIKLHVDNPPKVSSDTYTCIIDESSVCMNLVTVGTKPQPVTDFDCIGYNFDNLTCTWTPPENYVKTTYNLTFTVGGRSSRFSLTCPFMKYPDTNDSDKRMSCFWNVSTTPHYRQVHPEFYYTLTMTNKFGTNQLNKTFKHFSHVLSGPPESLTAISTTPSSIYLYWMVPTAMQTFPPGVHHRILYQCEYGERKWHFGGLITNKKLQKDVTFNLTNLKYAHALCDIRVSLRSAEALPDDESMWSRNTSITVRTSSKVPDAPPKTDIGSFEIVAFGNSLQLNEAYIYWQQIREDQKNGPDFKYVIKVEGNNSLLPIEITNAYAKFQNLSISSGYKFNIWSQNANGTSLDHSSVYIPKKTDRVSEPLSFTKVEFGDGEYELTWEPPKLPPNQVISNYTIFWCSNERERPYQCNGKLDWKVVPANKTVHNGTVAKNKIFQFAISVNSNHSSSGMSWADCTVIHDKYMGKMKNVWINKLGPTFIEVGWKLDCADRIGRVQGFIVYYCPIISPVQTECKDPQQNVTIYGTTSLGGNITNLTPYTIYMLTVAVITKHTTYSRQSDPLFNTTLEAAPSSPPQHLQLIDVTNSSISLSWKPPIAMNGILKYYEIEYNHIPVKVNNRTSLTLTNLTSYGNYLISIKACTVECSDSSQVLNVTTKMGRPSRIKKPTVDRRNDTSITIVWGRPSQPGGKNDYYEVQFKQKHRSENITKLISNVTSTKYVIEKCGDAGKFNTFYVSVRAVNIIKNKSFAGPWSDELENYCDTPINYIMYVLSVVVILFLIGIGFLSKKMYKYCKLMRDVEVKLPPGLAPEVADHTLVPWNTEKHQEDRDSHSRADEELLLVKMSEARHLSGDSSGCSSGHESVTSSIESGGTHLSSSSDSGTEQTGNYCVLEVDPKADTPYVLVTTDSNKVPYKTCNVSNDSSPYVMTGDVVKTINPGYIPFNQTDPIGKSSGYVVAGLKNCNGYIPFNQTETVNSVVAGVKNCKLD